MSQGSGLPQRARRTQRRVRNSEMQSEKRGHLDSCLRGMTFMVGVGAPTFI